MDVQWNIVDGQSLAMSSMPIFQGELPNPQSDLRASVSYDQAPSLHQLPNQEQDYSLAAAVRHDASYSISQTSYSFGLTNPY
ncbi:hypothetical protein A0H81_13158 [Grifola frondosa]|uniref:Uncharacterized protein n=1 Tax=Grifola frondosa TaxID=5627 RepID=A0A1C7LPR2_GRIFR|nr:hypothetical protein A0H81_13158 [Grifola frondosa]